MDVSSTYCGGVISGKTIMSWETRWFAMLNEGHGLTAVGGKCKRFVDLPCETVEYGLPAEVESEEIK